MWGRRQRRGHFRLDSPICSHRQRRRQNDSHPPKYRQRYQRNNDIRHALEGRPLAQARLELNLRLLHEGDTPCFVSPAVSGSSPTPPRPWRRPGMSGPPPGPIGFIRFDTKLSIGENRFREVLGIAELLVQRGAVVGDLALGLTVDEVAVFEEGYEELWEVFRRGY